MVIEHAERFGLAQLHQLRGRVGRGAERSTCLLLYKAPLGETAKARLAIMRETEDGFRIAEEDLKLRGEGEVLGTRQTGMPGFRVARLEVHGDLLGGGARRRRADPVARPATWHRERGEALRTALSVRARRSGAAAARRLITSTRGVRRRRTRRRRARALACSTIAARFLLPGRAFGCTMPADIDQASSPLDRDVELDDRSRAAHRRRSRWSGSACTA